LFNNYVVQVSDGIRGNNKGDHAESMSLLNALYITCFAAAIGGGLFLMATFFIRNDWHQVELYANKHRGKLSHNVATSTSSDDESNPLVHSDFHEQSSVNT